MTLWQTSILICHTRWHYIYILLQTSAAFKATADNKPIVFVDANLTPTYVGQNIYTYCVNREKIRRFLKTVKMLCSKIYRVYAKMENAFQKRFPWGLA